MTINFWDIHRDILNEDVRSFLHDTKRVSLMKQDIVIL
jgi:hypothetical protein